MQFITQLQHLDALHRFKTLFSSIVACFETISTDSSALWSPDSFTDWSALLLAITNSEFVSALVVVSNSLSYLLPLTKSLQSESKDIVQAVQEISHLEGALKDLRTNIDRTHTEWFMEIEEMCQSSEVAINLPRLCGRQQNRANVPAQTPTDCYWRTITIPVLDHLISHIQSRFSEHQKTALLGLHLIPSIIVTKSLAEIWDTLQPLQVLYAHDLDDNFASFRPELHSWYLKWKEEENHHGRESLPTTLAFTFPQSSPYYANIDILLRILCTLPVTSCSAERSFSALKRTKTSLRSTMTNSRLTTLTLLHIHQNISVDITQAIDEFARANPRRMKLNF